MENLFNFTDAQLLKEWLKSNSYQQILSTFDVIAVGLEGFEILMELKAFYPNLQVGYFYHSTLDQLSDVHGNSVLANFTFIPLDMEVKCYIGDYYLIKYLNKDVVLETLKYLSDNVLIIGSMADPILIRLLEFYSFNQKNLLLRRPMYFETSSLRGNINKYLHFSVLPANVRVIDAVKINRSLLKLDGQVTMFKLHQEIYKHWFAHIKLFLDLQENENWDLPRVRLEAATY